MDFDAPLAPIGPGSLADAFTVVIDDTLWIPESVQTPDEDTVAIITVVDGLSPSPGPDSVTYHPPPQKLIGLLPAVPVAAFVQPLTHTP